MCSGVVVAVIAWCIQARGPVFVSIFNPLSLLIVALVGSLVLEEELHLGRYIYFPTSKYIKAVFLEELNILKL